MAARERAPRTRLPTLEEGELGHCRERDRAPLLDVEVGKVGHHRERCGTLLPAQGDRGVWLHEVDKSSTEAENPTILLYM